MSSREEETVQALIAVEAIVGTLAMAQALVEDPAAAEAIRTSLAGALTARTMLERAVDGDPVKQPQKSPYGVMGQDEEEGAEEGPPLRNPLWPDEDACEHADILHGDDGSKLCPKCGKDEWWPGE